MPFFKLDTNSASPSKQECPLLKRKVKYRGGREHKLSHPCHNSRAGFAHPRLNGIFNAVYGIQRLKRRSRGALT